MNSHSSELLQKVENLAREVVLREGCQLYDVEFTSSMGQRVLRVYIDKLGTPVGVDDCANVSRGLNLLLDVEDVIPGGRYNLEVSSPGLERVLKKPEHFQSVVGQKVWMKLERSLQSLGVTDMSFASAKQVQGTLLETSADKGLRLQLSGRSDEAGIIVDVPWDAIEKAKSIFEFGTEKKPGASKKPKG